MMQIWGAFKEWGEETFQSTEEEIGMQTSTRVIERW
jgi:hypothetical protein